MRGVGQAHGADAAVVPRLFDDPGAGVVAVRPFVDVLGERAFGLVTPAAILVQHSVSVPHEIGGNRLARHRLVRPDTQFGPAGCLLVVGRALQDRRQALAVRASPGQIDVGRHANAIAHRDHDVAQDDDFGVILQRSSGFGRHHFGQERTRAHPSGREGMASLFCYASRYDISSNDTLQVSGGFAERDGHSPRAVMSARMGPSMPKVRTQAQGLARPVARSSRHSRLPSRKHVVEADRGGRFDDEP